MIPSGDRFSLQAMLENVLSELNLLNILLMYFQIDIYVHASIDL